MRALLGLLIRRYRLRILAWVLPLVGLVAISPRMYASTYATAQERAVIVAQLRASAGTKLVYGELPLPGSAGQTMVWEIGTWVALLGCISTMLLGLALTRGEEESGGVELVRSHGVSTGRWLVAAMLVVLGQVVLLVGGVTLAVAVQVGHAAEITTRGALALGLALLLVTSLFGALGLLAGQVLPSSGQARAALFVLLAAAFVAKGLGEANEWGWMRWCSPLAWLQLVSAFTRDRFGAALMVAPVPLLALGLAWWAARRREFGAGLVHSSERSTARARVHGVFGLTGLLGARSMAGWLLGVAGTAAFFASMAETLTSAARKDARTEDLMSQMTGGLNPTAGYFSYMGCLVGLLAACAAVSQLLRVRRQETLGLLDPVLATGRRREAPLAAGLVWAWLSGAVMVLTGAGLGLAATQFLLDDPDAWRYALRALLGQLPAMALCAALAALLVGALPRWSQLAWLPVAASATLTLLGPTMKAPGWLVDCSVFSHADVTGWDAIPALLMVALGMCLAGLALVAMRRRDIVV